MSAVLAGLTRDLPAQALDPAAPAPEADIAAASHYRPSTDVLGAVLPSNSPGVHGLWLPAIALGIPLALKPGREEPWTPLRLLRALAAAGCPPGALGFYPSDHAGATEILLRAGRSLLFGDARTVGPWGKDPRVQIHGPGLSKVIFGADQVAEWPRYLETVVSSVAQNGGRSCLNASGVWLPVGGRAAAARELAEALAGRLATIEARSLSDPRAEIAAFPSAITARRISAWIDQQLATPGAEDLTATVRGKDRVAEVEGCTFLLPTVIWVSDPDHPLAHAELLFPFCAVVAAPADEILDRIGPTLVATAFTADPGFRQALLDCPTIDHLNFGPVPTWQISFAQPHEGNLFDHLYQRRAIRELRPKAEAVS
jgi:acyl-CoA reductase-like NAD-dependent aldehyde dehydrogenase